jgi:hypothetical protein
LSRDYSKLNDKKIGEELYFKRAPPRFFDGRYLPSLHQRRPISQLAVHLSHHSNYFSKGLIFFAPWGAAVSCVHQSPCLGAGLLWRSLGRSLRANFNACAALLWLAAGCGQPPAACVQNQFVYKNGLSALPLRHSKKYTVAAMQSLFRIMLESGLLGAGVVRARPPLNLVK